jgi:hypothetical protein
MHRDVEHGLVLYVLYRGANRWTRIKLVGIKYRLSALGYATYKNETFYFFDKTNGVVTFSVKDRRCSRQTIVMKGQSTTTNVERLPCFRTKSHFVERDMKKKLRLGKDVSVSICGTILESGDSGGKIVRSLRLPKKKKSKNHHLRGVWIKPRFFQVSSNQSWSLRGLHFFLLLNWFTDKIAL